MAQGHWLLLLMYTLPIIPASLSNLSQQCPSSQFRVIAATSLTLFSITCLTTSSLLSLAMARNDCGHPPLATTIGVYSMSAILFVGALASAYSAAHLLLNSGHSLYLDGENVYAQCFRLIKI